MPSVHLVGALVGAAEFAESTIFCRWRFVLGAPGWSVISGDAEGQTQAADVEETADGLLADWSHPIDVHFGTSSLAGWPQLVLQVWRHDEAGRNEICGYASMRVPLSAGRHLREVAVWRPKGTMWEELAAWFRGGLPSLRDPDLPAVLNANRSELATVTVGSVLVDLSVLLQGFAGTGLHTAPISSLDASLLAARKAALAVPELATASGGGAGGGGGGAGGVEEAPAPPARKGVLS